MNTGTWIKKLALIAGALCVSFAANSLPVSGGLGLAGTSLEVQSGIDFSNVGTTPDGILDSNWSTTFVLVAENDLSVLEMTDDVLITDVAFNLSLPVGGLWLTSNSGFNFKISSLFLNDVGNPLFKDYSGAGILSLTGFDDTPATWHYSSTDSKTYTLSIVTQPVDVPEPSALALLLVAGGVLGSVRRFKARL